MSIRSLRFRGANKAPAVARRRGVWQPIAPSPVDRRQVEPDDGDPPLGRTAGDFPALRTYTSSERGSGRVSRPLHANDQAPVDGVDSGRMGSGMAAHLHLRLSRNYCRLVRARARGRLWKGAANLRRSDGLLSALPLRGMIKASERRDPDPVQKCIFHQEKKNLTPLRGLQYSPGK